MKEHLIAFCTAAFLIKRVYSMLTFSGTSHSDSTGAMLTYRDRGLMAAGHEKTAFDSRKGHNGRLCKTRMMGQVCAVVPPQPTVLAPIGSLCCWSVHCAGVGPPSRVVSRAGLPSVLPAATESTLSATHSSWLPSPAEIMISVI